ncbi:MAG: hypothetical protein J6A01_02005 [Proteobacteria bacterium]|nr:hypothetical protein [Pseudomonadota bacterium]
MTNKRLFMAAILGILTLYGCSDDSNKRSTTPATQCISEADCPSGVCLETGECAVMVDEGESCNEIRLCKDELECVQGTCKAKENPAPPECTGDTECTDGLVCINGECKEKTSKSSEPAWEEAQDCSHTPCPKGFICEQEHQKCVQPVADQGDCSGKFAWCAFGECKDGVCYSDNPEEYAKVSDKDGDTIADYYESCEEDTDNDGTVNCEDLDSDGDTIPDYMESGNGGDLLVEPAKADEYFMYQCSGDAFCPIYAFLTQDSDNNGIPDNPYLYSGDTPDNPEAFLVVKGSDGSTKYYVVYDQDNGKWKIVSVTDDVVEEVGAYVDTATGKVIDSSGNVVQITNENGDPEDLIISWSDIDNDTIPDYMDNDTDGDSTIDTDEIAGIKSSDPDGDLHMGRACVESCGCNEGDLWCPEGGPSYPWDSDGDTIPDYRDFDSDGDGILDQIELDYDSNHDGTLDRYSLDSDGDGILDSEETDETTKEPIKNENGEYCFTLTDCDYDGLSDKEELECKCIIDKEEKTCASNIAKQDTDGDNAPDVLECALKTDPQDPASNPQANGQFVFYAPYEKEITPKVQKMSFETAIQAIDMMYIFDSSYTMQEEAASIRDNLPGMIHALECVKTTKACTQNKDCDVLEDNYLEGKSDEEKAKLKGAICSEKGVCIQNPAYEDTVTIGEKELKIEGCFDDMWTGLGIYTFLDTFSLQIPIQESNQSHLDSMVNYLNAKVSLNHAAGGFNGNYEAAYQPPLCAVLNPGENMDLCMHKSSHIWTTNKDFWITADEKKWECNTDTATKVGCAGFRKNAIRIILHAFDENQCLLYLSNVYDSFFKDFSVDKATWMDESQKRCMRFKNEVGQILQNKRVRYIGLYSEAYANNLPMYDEQETMETVAKKIGTDSGSVDSEGNPFVYLAFDSGLAAKAAEGVRSIAKHMPMTVTSDVQDIDVPGVSELIQLMDVIPDGGELVQNRLCVEVQGTIKEEQTCEQDNGVTKCDGIDNMLPGKVVCYNVVPVEKQNKFQPTDKTSIYQARVMVKGDGSVLNSAIVYFVVPPKTYQPIN